MSCPNCGAENAPGARFCSRCGASLARRCANCGADLAEGARFCSACGTPVEPEAAELAEERKLVTILFADVTGSTQLGERLDPERMKEVMSRFFAAMRAEIEAEGGTVEKFIGDAIMAAFGVPAAHEDDPSRALRAVMRMRTSLDALNRDLEREHGVSLAVRTGVNTGEVIAVTDPRPGEALATGDAVNVAARLEQAAEPGQVLVAERTARAARGFRFRDLGPVSVKGKEEPVRALELLGTAEGAEGAQRGIPGLRAPMVGRDEELSLLRTVYRRLAAEGQPNLATIYGDPGVGKSRLAREFAAWVEVQEPRPTVLAGRCLPYGEGVTYWPLAEILKSHAGVLDSDPPDRALARIRAATEALLATEAAADPARTAAALAFAMGLEDPAFRLADLAPRQVRLETHNAWRAFFSEIARPAPAVVVVEDIHWADPALLDLLEDLADRALGPVLFLCPARPELTGRRAGWGGGRRNFTSIFLEPLSHEDADRLVGFLLAIEDLPESVHERILARAEGNPFFLEEILRRLIDEGRIVREGDRWRASAAIGEVEIPDTVQAVLAARIDLLASEEKRALQSAAVVGRVFWSGPVGELLNGEGERLEEILQRLEDRELVSARLGSSLAGEREYIFKHVLTRDVAYESLPRRERAVAHAEVASWIERTAGERRSEFAELLAYHYSEAHRSAGATGDREGLRRKAFEYLVAAARGARAKFSVATAVRLGEEAASLADGPLERSRALEVLGLTYIDDYRGFPAYDTLRAAVKERIAGDPTDHLGIAMLCARAIETPTRWPGAMQGLPPAAEAASYLATGLEHAGTADSEARLRLLTARAFWPFAYPDDTPPEEWQEAERAGEEA
ncbi:MAG TPA: adenylate/guanylate cyclase domain-containing protein, partial [Actinomycetota bacterium]|nr:adenylate/guanylate cyclase domain-containing protein [Actinomycetota bacterium]